MDWKKLAICGLIIMFGASFCIAEETAKVEEPNSAVSFLPEDIVNYTYSVGESMLVTQDNSGIVQGLGLPHESSIESMIKMNFSVAPADWAKTVTVYEPAGEGEQSQGPQPYRPAPPTADTPALKLEFNKAMQSWLINGSSVQPMVNLDSELNGKQLFYTYDANGIVGEVYNLDAVIFEFSPIDINCLLLMLQPPVPSLLDKSTWDKGVTVNLAFPRTWDAKLSVTEKLAVKYSYVGDSFWQEKPCYVFQVEIKGDELTSSTTSISSTFAQANGTGTGTIMWSPESKCTMWSEVELDWERVKQLTLKTDQYILQEKTGTVFSLAREAPAETGSGGEGEGGKSE
jgi:hypothetical protein